MALLLDLLIIVLAWPILKYFVLAAAAVIGIYFFGRYVGPNLPPWLGGDDRSLGQAVPNDKQWDLYLAMNSFDTARVKECLRAGADPYTRFSATRRPSTTDARNCYEYAKEKNREDIIAVFEEHRRRA